VNPRGLPYDPLETVLAGQKAPFSTVKVVAKMEKHRENAGFT
jgi:hypothetical protein